MDIKVLGFGIAREIMGGPQVTLPLVSGATVADMKAVLEHQFPQLGKLATYMVAVNNEYADAEHPIKANDEIAIIPPVSGG